MLYFIIESQAKRWGGRHFSSGEPLPHKCLGLMILPCCLIGQLVNPVHVQEGHRILYSSIFEANITIHNVAVSAYSTCG